MQIRRWLIPIGAAVCALACALLVVAYESDTLRDAAIHRGIYLGSAVSFRHLDEDSYRTVLAREFNQVEAENEMKWGYLRPARETFRFDAGDRLVEFASAHVMRVRGHVLLWHQYNPKWLAEGKFPPGELHALLNEHITTVVQHYARKVYAWDVVNEAFDDNGQLRDSLWYNKPGIEVAGKYGYIEEAFRIAHEADPDALLFYNDYSAEVQNPKSDAIYAMVQDFKKRRVPIHGVGFQCHLEAQGIDRGKFLANLKRFADLGVQLHITELDVRLPLQPGGRPAPDMLTQQAAIYRNVAEACVKVKACTSIQLWGFTDRYSWVPFAFKGTGAALPYDADYKPKPAWEALKGALEKH